jgi:hypothetical protein
LIKRGDAEKRNDDRNKEGREIRDGSEGRAMWNKEGTKD